MLLSATRALQPDTDDDNGADCGDWTSCSRCVNTASCYWAGGSCSTDSSGCGTSGCCSGPTPTPAPSPPAPAPRYSQCFEAQPAQTGCSGYPACGYTCNDNTGWCAAMDTACNTGTCSCTACATAGPCGSVVDPVSGRCVNGTGTCPPTPAPTPPSPPPGSDDDNGADCGDWTSCSRCVNTKSCYWAGGSCSSNPGGCGTSGCCSGGSGGAPTPAPTYDCSSCPELTFDCPDLAAACPGLHINCAKSTCGGGTSIGGIIGGVLGAMAGGILLRYLCRRYGNSQTATKKQPLLDADTEAGSDYVAQN